MNLSVIGPSTWEKIHNLAINTVDKKSEEIFIKYIENISNNFPCDICKKHINKYIKEHPFPCEYLKYFKWSWIFHNTVNIRIGKKFIPWNTALSIFNLFLFNNNTET